MTDLAPQQRHCHRCDTTGTPPERIGDCPALVHVEVRGPEAPCVFCAIIRGEEPAAIIRSWYDAIAIVPLNPITEGHLLVIPRQHVADFRTDAMVSAATMENLADLANELQIGDANVITSRGRAATQSVFHLHFHLIPRAVDDGLALPWYSGKRSKARPAVSDSEPPTDTQTDRDTQMAPSGDVAANGGARRAAEAAAHPVVVAVLAVAPLLDGEALVDVQDETDTGGGYAEPIYGDPEPIASRQAAAVLRKIAYSLRLGDDERINVLALANQIDPPKGSG